MDPLSRKLFQSREAREKLRQQGGIMASSPELAQTVAKFANGGPTELQIPRVRSAIQEGGMSYPSYRMLSRSQKRELGYPVSEIGGQLAFDRFGVGLGLVNPMDRFTPSGLNVSDILPSSVGRNAPTIRPDTEGTGENMPRPSAGRNPRRRSTTTDTEMDRLARESADEAARFRDEQGITDARESMGAAIAAGDEEEAARIAQDARKALGIDEPPETTDPVVEEPKMEPDDSGSPRPNEQDFDTTYEQMLERLSGIMGEDSDEDKKKKAMANLAMIGLAIAAGQSPNALTNIAQGALTGMKGIQEAEAAKASDERELKLAALKMASDEVELSRRLKSAEDIAAIRAAGGTGTYTPERLYQQNINAILSNPDMFDVFTGNAVDPMKVRKLAQSLSERGMSVGGGGDTNAGSQFTPGQQVVQNGVTYEYQEDGTWKPVGE